ncbi:MAG: ABC transporter permease [Deltaproteobacteria bacterium]|uniref:ABC transporter permease n=1 Tax=Candidatus Zymogenus saltonus TaxID=2844893 RepID=A0A9D8KFZ0_9DELT|nr:ABC transporter permease [Candidatus Zymogenus saltonus]
MRIRRIRAVVRKEWLQILRDRRSLFLALGIPMIMIVMFGWALKMDVTYIKTVVYDQDRSVISRDFISKFSNIRYFDIVDYVYDYDDVVRLMDLGKIKAAIVIPEEFAEDIKAGRGSDVQLIADGTDPLTAQVLAGYVSAITSRYSQEYVLEGLSKAGLSITEPFLDVSIRVWFNPELESKNFIIPGFIAVIMMIIAGLLTSLTFAREWERGTMEQLVSTPIKVPELVFGKLIPYVELGIIDFLLITVVGTLVFRVPLKGNILLLFLLTLIFLVGAMSLGMLISIVAKKQVLASQMAILATFLPSFLLSGFVFPIPNMPVVLRAITYGVTARYFVTILKGIFLKGIGLSILWIQGLLLIVFSSVVLILAMRKFKKEL